MTMLRVPPTTLKYDPLWEPQIVNVAHAQMLYDIRELEPVVIHQDEILAEEQVVIAAIYLGIPLIEVIMLESVDEHIPDEVLDYVGSSNDA